MGLYSSYIPATPYGILYAPQPIVERRKTNDNKTSGKSTGYLVSRLKHDTLRQRNMAQTNSQKIVLVTGINGYIAQHIGLQLLEQGYTVRGTTRSVSAKDQLFNEAFKDYKSQFQHYIVPDITAPGAFDDAVKGVFAIIHTASPVDFTLQSLDAFVTPAVSGNLSILNSALQHAVPQLRSFVLTSSIAAIADRWSNPPDHIYSEADWNTQSEVQARQTFTAPVAYGASKTLAERALWKFQAEQKVPFACAAINPAVVTGPPVSLPTTPEKLNTTLVPVWKLYAGEAKTIPPQIGYANYIDVRDVAKIHVWAALNPEKSNGNRYLVAAGKAPPQATADLLRRTFPDREILEGQPGAGYDPNGYPFVKGEPSFVSTKTLKALEMEHFIGFEKSILDSIASFEAKWPGLAKNFKN